MNITRISLLSESSARDLTQGTQRDPQSTHLDFSFGLQRAENKPWTYELTMHMEIRSAEDSNDIEPVFATHMQYALAFDTGKEISTTTLTPTIVTQLWPLLRGDLSDQLHRYELPTSMLPIVFSCNER